MAAVVDPAKEENVVADEENAAKDDEVVNLDGDKEVTGEKKKKKKKKKKKSGEWYAKGNAFKYACWFELKKGKIMTLPNSAL